MKIMIENKYHLYYIIDIQQVKYFSIKIILN